MGASSATLWGALILFVLGYTAQNIFAVFWTGSSLSPFGILLVNAAFYPLVFGLCLLVHARRLQDWSVLKPVSWHYGSSLSTFLLLLSLGTFNALNGVLIIYASPGSKTPPLMQAILQSTGLLFAVPFSKLLLGDMRHYSHWKPILSGLLVLGAVAVSVLPTALSDGGFAGGGGVQGNSLIWWCLIYFLGMAPAAAFNVLQQRYLILHGALPAGLAQYMLYETAPAALQGAGAGAAAAGGAPRAARRVQTVDSRSEDSEEEEEEGPSHPHSHADAAAEGDRAGRPHAAAGLGGGGDAGGAEGEEGGAETFLSQYSSAEMMNLTASLRMLFYGSLFQLLAMLSFFWVDLMPFFGYAASVAAPGETLLKASWQSTAFTLLCSFAGPSAASLVSVDGLAQPPSCSSSAPLYAYAFLAAYTVSYLGGALLNQESSAFTMLVFSLTTVATTAFWLIPGLNPHAEHTPLWSVLTSLLLCLLGVWLWRSWESSLGADGRPCEEGEEGAMEQAGKGAGEAAVDAAAIAAEASDALLGAEAEGAANVGGGNSSKQREAAGEREREREGQGGHRASMGSTVSTGEADAAERLALQESGFYGPQGNIKATDRGRGAGAAGRAGGAGGSHRRSFDVEAGSAAAAAAGRGGSSSAAVPSSSSAPRRQASMFKLQMDRDRHLTAVLGAAAAAAADRRGSFLSANTVDSHAAYLSQLLMQGGTPARNLQRAALPEDESFTW